MWEKQNFLFQSNGHASLSQVHHRSRLVLRLRESGRKSSHGKQPQVFAAAQHQTTRGTDSPLCINILQQLNELITPIIFEKHP